MILAVPPDDKAAALLQCPACDQPDPLKSASVDGWLKSSLRPPA